MKIQRDLLLNEVIARKGNGMIKVVTGMRRSGKSYLLFTLFCDHLRSCGVDDQHIITIDLEDRRNAALRNPDALLQHIDSHLKDNDMHYIVLDEVQLVPEFEDVLNSYLKVPNADVYVTGSNARFLSSDIITEFRGRGDEIRVHPLSFKEFASVRQGDRTQLIEEYMLYGGLPQVVTTDNVGQKTAYLKRQFTHTYLKDIKERNAITKDDDLEELVSLVASYIGGTMNLIKLSNTFKSEKKRSLSRDTIKQYLDYLQDAFMIEKAMLYDIKGKRYINTPHKYYFEDLGVRNTCLNFRQVESTHLMENLIYNELRQRGFSVDVGQVAATETIDGVRRRMTLEVDFVCNQGYRRYYIQSALALPTPEKIEQELRSLRKINDGFMRVLIVGTPTPIYQNEDGIMIMSLYDFLVDKASLIVK